MKNNIKKNMTSFLKYLKLINNLCKECINNIVVQQLITVILVFNVVIIHVIFVAIIFMYIFFLILIIFFLMSIFVDNYYYLIEFQYIYYKLILLKIIIILSFLCKFLLDLSFYLSGINVQNLNDYREEKFFRFTFNIEGLFILILLCLFFNYKQFFIIFLISIMYYHFSKNIFRIIDDYVYKNKIKILLKSVIRTVFFLLVFILISQFII